MLSQIKIKKWKTLLFFGLFFLLYSCIPDRLPTEPVENTRPAFVSIEINGGSNLVVKLNSEIKAVFNESMNLETFPDNFKVLSAIDEITGEFMANDSIVVFKPTQAYSPAQLYEINISGKVRDVHGNSVISPNEEDQPQSSWFFTQGQYSQNGFPLIFVRDKSEKQVIHRVGQLNKSLGELSVQATVEDYQTASIEFSPNGQYLYMVNLKTVDGTVTVIDPQNFSVVKTIDVGLGPTNISFGSDKAFISNTSGKSITTIDVNNHETISTYEFSDGFKPKDLVYSPITNKLYIYSSSAKQIKVVEANNYQSNYNLDEVLTDSKGVDIEITNDGRYIYLIQDRTDKIIVFDVQTDTVIKTIETGNPYIIDGAMGEKYYFAAFFKKVDKDLVGGITKIDLASNSIISTTMWDKEIDQIGLTNANELLYAVVPVDSTLSIFETETVKEISSTKVEGSLKYLAVSKNNYQ